MLITLLGPTAAGKTSLAARLAQIIRAEIISADSRQVYRGMDIGTGKDLNDYLVDGEPIAYHLIDICEAGEEYNVYRFVHDFAKAYDAVTGKGKKVILCGGTGMYIEALLKGYNLVNVPENIALRDDLQPRPMEELRSRLLSLGPVHATSDLNNKSRLITAIEKRMYYLENKIPEMKEGIPSVVFGLKHSREIQRDKITARLYQRLGEGMIEEVKMLIDKGVNIEQLLSYGLEYKWITLFLTGQCSYETMVSSLNVAIHRFAKRQLTWFRRMERNGIKIFWIDANITMDEKLKFILETLNKIDR